MKRSRAELFSYLGAPLKNVQWSWGAVRKSDEGGDRAAAIFTLIGTAKLNKVDPEAYLRYALERIADHPINRIEDLLPWEVASALEAHKPRVAA